MFYRFDAVTAAKGERMEFTIREVSQRFNLSSSTLRYYDKEGLFPFMQKKASGYRTFSEKDLACLELVQCLKSTGLSIKEIAYRLGYCNQFYFSKEFKRVVGKTPTEYRQYQKTFPLNEE